MDQKKDQKDQVKKGLDRLDQLNIDELSDSDLNSVAGGNTEREIMEDVSCNSTWCCSNTSN